MKMKIDTSKWEEFKIGDLFEIKKGTRLTKANMKDGDNNFVSASAANNGITAHISNSEHIHSANTITITYNGSVGEAFYQDSSFWASDDVNVLYSKFELNKYIALFIIPVLKQTGKKYAFIDKWKKEDMENDYILLPVDENHQPDFSYMEEYMKNREIAVSSSLTKLQSAKSSGNLRRTDVSEWEEFKISSIFAVKRPEARSQSNYESGDVPFVASGNYNNGVLKYLSPKKDEMLDKGNCITVSPVDGSAFYQENDFLGRGGAGSSIILLYNEKLNIYSGYFIATVIRSVCRKYFYSDMANKDTIANEIIKLPADDNHQPDFLYMEDYIKKIIEKSETYLNNLKNV